MGFRGLGGCLVGVGVFDRDLVGFGVFVFFKIWVLFYFLRGEF